MYPHLNLQLSFVSQLPALRKRRCQHFSGVFLTRCQTNQYRSSSKPMRNQVTMKSSQESSGSDTNGLPDFDRDYYDELKAKYAGVEGIHIISKDEYEIDPTDAPWLLEDRGRDLKKIRENMSKRPVGPDELDEISGRAMRCDDLHTPEELEDFEPLLQYGDPVSGRGWVDPMPESEFNPDPKWIDMRKMDDDVMKAVHDQLESEISGLSSTPLPSSHRYASEEEEIAALEDSYEQMRAECLDVSYERTSYSESVPIPDQAEFEAWQKVAEERGGNSTTDESYFLSPFRDHGQSEDASTNSTREKDPNEPPKQHQCLVDTHQGHWEGHLAVFSLMSDENLSPLKERCALVRSRVTLQEDGVLAWTTVVTTPDSEIVSGARFSNRDCKDALVPGRGVSEAGSYVCSKCENSVEDSESGFSVSASALRAILQDSSCKAICEICMMTQDEGDVVRHRVLLCAEQKRSETKSKVKTKKPRFLKVIVLSELHLDGSLREKFAERYEYSSVSGLPQLSLSKFIGSWAGHGIVLHPSFPPVPCRPVETRFRVEGKQKISDTDVTWVDYSIPIPGQESKSRIRSLGKKKISKRVAAARKHDQNRLSKCSILTREETGSEAPEEIFAWRAEPSEDAMSHMYSPRVGRFPCDYGGLLVRDDVLLTFPLESAFPAMWNTITLAKLGTPMRTRICAGRNEFGELVGVIFAKETLQDGADCDEVASYV